MARARGRRIIHSNKSLKSGFKQLFLFLWEGNFVGDDLKNEVGDDAITVTGKDFATSYIPATSVATLSVPFDGLYWMADEDSLWHTALSKKEVTVSDLLRIDPARTFVKYADNSPHHIEKIGIIHPFMSLSPRDKSVLMAEFGLHKYYWGYLDANGTVKQNRNASHQETMLVSAELQYMQGQVLLLKFNKEIIAATDEGSPPTVNNVVVKVDGVPVSVNVDGAWAPWRFYKQDNSPIATPGSIVTVSITGDADFKGADGVPLNSVVDFTVENNVPVTDFTIIQESAAVLDRPHGSCVVAGKMFFGCRTNPAKIVRFNNVADLSDVDDVELTGYFSADSLAYDADNSKIYTITRHWDTLEDKLVAINPTTLAYTVVMDMNPTTMRIDHALYYSDGYLYCVGGTNIYKIDVSNFSYVVKKINNFNGGHNIAAYQFDDRLELYSFGASTPSKNGYSAGFLKINAHTLSHTVVWVGNNDTNTDDICIKYLDKHGVQAYCGAEINSYLGTCVDSRSMRNQYFPSVPSYGWWMVGSDLIVTGGYGVLLKYVNADLTAMPIITRLPLAKGDSINELLVVGGRVFITTWASPAILMEIDTGIPLYGNRMLLENGVDRALLENGIDYVLLEN